MRKNFNKEKKSKEKPGKWSEWLKKKDFIRTVYLIFGFCVIFLLMFLLQFSTTAICCGDWDGYYHIRWSAMIWENIRQAKWLPEFTWLPLTILNPENYADHHFFFHILQIPFLWFFNPVMAAKTAAVFYGGLAIFSVYWLMFRYKTDYLLLWLAVLLTCAEPFFYRMNMAKAPPLTIIYSIVGIHLLFQKKYIWLMPLMFVFVWTYSLFPLLFIAAVIWTGIIWWNKKGFEWRPIFYTVTGMILGNVIHPYFPNNIILFFEHFYTKFRTNFDVAVGVEWYPYDGVEILSKLTVALIAMLIGYIAFKPKNGNLPEKTALLLVFSTILLIWMFRSKRLAEYFPPFAVLFGAFSLNAFLKPSAPQLPDDFVRDIAPFLDSEKFTEKEENKRISKRIVPWLLGIILIGLMFSNFKGFEIEHYGIKKVGLIDTIRKNEPNDKYDEAMEWANSNIPAGERIFNCDWDDFPKLYFLNSKHIYIHGLDPNYLYSKDPDLYELVNKITQGKVDDPAPWIIENLEVRYIFSDAERCEDFIAKTLESGWADTVYEDGETFILKLRDERGEPPELEDDKSLTPEEKAKLKEAEETENKNVNVNKKRSSPKEERADTSEDASDL